MGPGGEQNVGSQRKSRGKTMEAAIQELADLIDHFSAASGSAEVYELNLKGIQLMGISPWA